jgi:hypothetical protein
MVKLYLGRGRLALVVTVVGAAALAAFIWHVWKRGQPVKPAPPGNPVVAVRPATAPTSRPAEASKGETGYIDVVRGAYPDFPATQPLGVPVDLSHAAHLLINDPINLGEDPRKGREMWITRAHAPPIEVVLKEAEDPEKDIDVHIVRERVVFVHWMPAEQAAGAPWLVCLKDDGGYEVVSTQYGRQPLPVRRGYHWEHAFSFDESVVVAAEHGVSVFQFGPAIREEYHEFASVGPATRPAASAPASRPAGGFPEPRVLLDGKGFVAWLPWEHGKTGGRGAARYLRTPADESGNRRPGGTWTDLTPETGWPEKILHLVPLLDQTLLMLIVDDSGAVKLQFNTLERATVKEDVILALIDKLGDADKDVRDKAYDELAQYGPGIWPILDKELKEDPIPEAATRMKRLLKQRATPSLNGMFLLGKKTLKLAARLSDSGTVFYAEAGVSIPNSDDLDAAPIYHVPAWISIRPGRPIELLPGKLAEDLTIDQSRLYVNGNDWLVTNDLAGPRRFVGNGTIKMLRKSEHAYSEFLGSDRRGRWLFRKPGPLDKLRAGPVDKLGASNDTETLIIDPTLPDPSLRLPVWELAADAVGWTRDNWAVEKKNGLFAVREGGWEPLDAKEQIFTKAEEAPPPIEPAAPSGATTRPATTHPSRSTSRPSSTITPPPPVAATMPATSATTTGPSETPILTDRDGNRYFGGQIDLKIVSPAGKQTRWDLPANATGETPVWLVRTANGRLFLFNHPGRVLRIKPTPAGEEPFKLEKVFTHHVPAAAHPTRIWLDPAGRIIMAWENRLAIFFPAGYMPRAIADLIGEEPEEDE